jgi:hypothetical protein
LVLLPLLGPLKLNPAVTAALLLGSSSVLWLDSVPGKPGDDMISTLTLLTLLLLPPSPLLLVLLQVSSARAALESADLPGHAEQPQETLLPAAEQVGRGFAATFKLRLGFSW